MRSRFSALRLLFEQGDAKLGTVAVQLLIEKAVEYSLDRINGRIYIIA